MPEELPTVTVTVQLPEVGVLSGFCRQGNIKHHLPLRDQSVRIQNPAGSNAMYKYYTGEWMCLRARACVCV